MVNGVLPPELVAAESKEALETYPDMGPEDTATPPRQGVNDFPFDMPAKNEASVHPRLLRAVAQLLDTDNIRLSECQVWCKYGDYCNDDQPYSPITVLLLQQLYQPFAILISKALFQVLFL